MIAVKTRAVSIALACRTFEISETCYRYERLRLRGCELLQRSFSHEKISTQTGPLLPLSGVNY